MSSIEHRTSVESESFVKDKSTSVLRSSPSPEPIESRPFVMDEEFSSEPNRLQENRKLSTIKTNNIHKKVVNMNGSFHVAYTQNLYVV